MYSEQRPLTVISGPLVMSSRTSTIPPEAIPPRQPYRSTKLTDAPFLAALDGGGHAGRTSADHDHVSFGHHLDLSRRDGNHHVGGVTTWMILLGFELGFLKKWGVVLG